MLDGLRVVEISSPFTMLATRMLADLGADVVVVEPPGGAAGRRLAPFQAGRPGLHRSLTWHALNYNKRGVTLDLSCADGLALFEQLVARADAVVSCVASGDFVPDRIVIPDGTVVTKIEGFAPTSAKAGYVVTDDVLMAASGSPAATGTSDMPPVMFPVPQAMMEAGAEAALATLTGLISRQRNGSGQRTTVSARSAALRSSMAQPLIVTSGNVPAGRPTGRSDGPARVFECRDGYVVMTIVEGQGFGQMTNRLSRWLAKEGMLTPGLERVDWVRLPALRARGAVTAEDMTEFSECVRRICLTKTKMELNAAARTENFLAAAFFDMADVLAHPPFSDRGAWVELPVDGGRTATAPLRFARFSNHSIELRRPAPTLSEHTQEILEGDLGLLPVEIEALFANGVI
jgi:benzylsuccinate CoA-transferase BbsE subunit